MREIPECMSMGIACKISMEILYIGASNKIKRNTTIITIQNHFLLTMSPNVFVVLNILILRFITKTVRIIQME